MQLVRIGLMLHLKGRKLVLKCGVKCQEPGKAAAANNCGILARARLTKVFEGVGRRIQRANFVQCLESLRRCARLIELCRCDAQQKCNVTGLHVSMSQRGL